jgi:predicted 3-demethylubiquinone-9 3-methyltransferase (glyoxalase superfamily)
MNCGLTTLNLEVLKIKEQPMNYYAHPEVLVDVETDCYWNAIVGNDGQESACGWCKDKWGLSWQITPIALTKAITDPNAAQRAFDAMMQMKKIDVAAIEAARQG